MNLSPYTRIVLLVERGGGGVGVVTGIIGEISDSQNNNIGRY